MPINVPCDQGYTDTESSVTVPFSGWDDLTRHFKIHMIVESNNPDNQTIPPFCVQVAFGTDLNGSETLEPEETDLILGYDCGAWFLRDERGAPCGRLETGADHRGVDVSDVDSVSNTFNLSSVFDRSWNLVTVTFHNNPSATIRAEFKNNPMRIIVR